MSDGPTEAYHHVRMLVTQYLEQIVAYYECSLTPKEARESSEQMLALAAEMVNLKPENITQSTDLPMRLSRLLVNELKVGYLIRPFTLLFLLFSMRDFTKIIRLQKASDYRSKLLVFADDKHRVAENGVYYCSLSNFVDGDQDLILGLAKKRFQEILKRDESFLIIAHWNSLRKRWNLEDVIQD